MATEKLEFEIDIEHGKANLDALDDSMEVEIKDGKIEAVPEDDADDEVQGEGDKAGDTDESSQDDEELQSEIEAALSESQKDGHRGWERRLRKAHKNFHDVRREKESLQKERDEYRTYAQRILDENRKLKDQTGQSQRGMIESTKRAIQTEREGLKREFQEAQETGDTAKLWEVQNRLTQLGMYEGEVNNALRNQENEARYQQENPEVSRQDMGLPPIETAEEKNAALRTVDWAQKNPWFLQKGHESASGYLLGLDEELKSKGITPDKDEYWNSVETNFTRMFPNYRPSSRENPSGDAPYPSQGEARPKPSSPVAPAARNATGNRANAKKVRLSTEEMRVADQLDISYEDYARQKMELG